ncbi:MAG: ABC transporter permease, partial [Gemmatimonadota bacterium]|nr:ABC transporter permease [Gemmatimonadota bacterium]
MGATPLSYVIHRLAQGVVVVFAVATLVFVLLQAAPGDPLTVLSDQPQLAPEALERMRRSFGLDRPIPEQYVRYLGRLVRGDFGVSLTQHRPVLAALADALPNTLLLALAALLVDLTVGVGIGVVQGMRPRTLTDQLLSLVTITLYAMPVFWLGLLALVIFGQQLDWFPVGGLLDPVRHATLSPVGRVLDRLHH